MFVDYLKYLFVENLLVSVIVIFVLLYIYLNMELVYSGDYFGGYVMKPFAYTVIILFIGFLIINVNKKSNVVEGNTLTDTLSDKVGGNEKKYKIVNKDIFIANNNKHMFGLNM